MTSNYSLSEIQNLVANGATIYEDGSIEMPPETYSVTHEFVSGTSGMQLPDEVKNLLPTDQASLENGSEVTPGTIPETEIEVIDGIWMFQGWDADVKVIEGADQRFVGAWTFEKKAEPTSEAATDPESESGALTESEPTTAPESTVDPEPSSSVEASTEAPTESAPASSETSEVSKETSVDTKEGGNKLPLIVTGIVAVLGIAGFMIVRKKNNQKEEQ